MYQVFCMVFQRIIQRLGRYLMYNSTCKLSKYLCFPSAVYQHGTVWSGSLCPLCIIWTNFRRFFVFVLCRVHCIQGHVLLYKAMHYYTRPCTTIKDHALLCNTMHYYTRPQTTIQDTNYYTRHKLLYKTTHYCVRPYTTITTPWISYNKLYYIALLVQYKHYILLHN